MDYHNNKFFKLDNRISQLSNDDIDKLMEQYYNGESAKKLIEEYKINVNSSGLYRLFPPIINDDCICPYCKVPMQTKRESKSSYFVHEKPTCPICGHVNEEHCYCNNCVKIREERIKNEVQEKRNKINSFYKLDDLTPIDLENLSFEDKVYIGALLRAGISEDYSKIKPLNTINKSFAPTEELASKIIKLLHHKKIIAVHPDSPIEAFKDDDDFPSTFYIFDVYYYLNLESLFDRKSMINELINPTVNYESTEDEIYNIWLEITLNECFEYFDYSMKKVGFDFNRGEKTHDVILDLLNHFSAAQVNYIIYNSISKSIRYYQEGNVSRKQAANSVVTNCQNYGEKILVNNWELHGFRRDNDCPQSVISDFYFNRILKIGDDGYNKKPQKISLCSPEDIKVNNDNINNEKGIINSDIKDINDVKISIYKVFFKINTNIDFELVNSNFTYVKATSEEQAEERAIIKICNAFGINPNEVEVIDIVVSDNE